MEHILEIDKSDDMASIRGRINFALSAVPVAAGATGKQEKVRVLLLAPRANEALQKLVNMKLLARLAKTRAVDIAVVSDQPTVRDYAKEAGIKAFGSLKSAKRAGWVPSDAPVASPEQSEPPKIAANGGVQAPPPARPRSKKKKYVVVEGRGRVGWGQQVGALVALLILALALSLGTLVLLPEATVTLIPVAKPVETSLVVKADPEVDSLDFASLTFPARTDQVELELTDQIETIETEFAPVGRATGRVTFINRTDEFGLIPISTTVSTSAGEPVQFFTVQTTTLPAGVGATTSTLVIAAEPGPGGNVRAGQINRFENPTFGLVARVVNESGLGGGGLAETKVVVEADKERLQAHLRQLVQQEGLAQLEASLGQQEFIPPESLQVIVLDVQYEEFSGDFSDTFRGEMQAVVRGTVVGGYNANRLALAALQAQVPPGYELDIEGLQFGAGEVLDVQGRVTTFKIFANGRAIPEIDSRSVAEEIAWLPVGEAQAWLTARYDLATVPGVELQPAWLTELLGRLPYIPLRINVDLREAVTLTTETG